MSAAHSEPVKNGVVWLLSITESTSKAQYSKAKSKIRKILSEQNDE